jgi:hypothetical protein
MEINRRRVSPHSAVPSAACIFRGEREYSRHPANGCRPSRYNFSEISRSLVDEHRSWSVRRSILASLHAGAPAPRGSAKIVHRSPPTVRSEHLLCHVCSARRVLCTRVCFATGPDPETPFTIILAITFHRRGYFR